MESELRKVETSDGSNVRIYMVMATTKPSPKPKLVAEPAKAPFTSYVSGAGLIESSTENVKVGTTTGGLVTKVLVFFK